MPPPNEIGSPWIASVTLSSWALKTDRAWTRTLRLSTIFVIHPNECKIFLRTCLNSFVGKDLPAGYLPLSDDELLRPLVSSLCTAVRLD